MQNILIYLFISISLLIYPKTSLGNDNMSPEDLIGLWHAQRDYGPDIHGDLTIYQSDKKWFAQIVNYEIEIKITNNQLSFELPGGQGKFIGNLSKDKDSIVGFWIQPPNKANYNRFVTPVTLFLHEENHWTGKLNPLKDKMTFYLSISKNTDGSLKIFLKNPEANFGRYFSIEKVIVDNDFIQFLESDIDNVRLQGPYYPEQNIFSIYIPDAGGTFDFHKVEDKSVSQFVPRPSSENMYQYKKPLEKNDGWKTATLKDVGMNEEVIESMINFTASTLIDSITSLYIHAILIARHGKLVLEEYFHGYNADMTHDTRSASKTVTTTLVGLAIQGGAPISVNSPVYEIMYDGKVPSDLDPRKKNIQLKHLLNMTPGLDCDDNDEVSPGSEWRMQSQTDQPDWWQFTLDLPVINYPGDVMTYCSASPNLAGGVLSKATSTWLPFSFKKYFSDPLQIDHYHINLMPSGDPYGGGGLYIKGRDFLKLAQLYLNNGTWNGKKLLSDEWLKEAFTPYKNLFNQGYGYGWWIMEFPYENRTVTAYYAGGNGGQYSIAIPELDIAIVFFGGNYNQLATHYIKKEHIPNYILKSISTENDK